MAKHYVRKDEIEKILVRYTQAFGHPLTLDEQTFWQRALERFGKKERNEVYRQQMGKLGQVLPLSD